MDRKEARRTLESLRDEVAATEKRLAALQKLVEGYLELFPELTDDAPTNSAAAATNETNRPKGQEAVRQVMMESPGKWFTVPLMLEELRKRGWLPETDEPGPAVRASLTRTLADPRFRKGRGQKTGAVTYTYKPSHAYRSDGDATSPERSDRDNEGSGPSTVDHPVTDGQDQSVSTLVTRQGPLSGQQI